MTKVLSAPEPGRWRVGQPAGSSPEATTPYLDAVHRYVTGEPSRLTVPGHKGGLAAPASLLHGHGAAAMALDVPQLIEGIDRASGHASPFELAERRAAVAWGAARTWFLTGGATQGNLAACLTVACAAATPAVAVQRSSHSSTFSGMALAGLRPTSVMPELDEQLAVAHGITPEALRAQLQRNPAIRAVFVVSPSYFGACADVRGLAAVAHEHGAVLVVDEAWGAHLRFSDALPPDALTSGADLVISSPHKHLGSLSGSAMLHLGHGAPAWLTAGKVDRALGLVTSTSPSSLLLASLDAARARAEVEGGPLLAMAVRELREVREAICEIPGLVAIDESFVGRPGFAGLDPLRLTIDVRATGWTGYQLAEALRASAGVELELALERVVVAVFGVGESPLASAEPMLDGLAALSHAWVRSRRAPAPRGGPAAAELAAASPRHTGSARRPHGPRAAQTPREALWAPSTLVPIEQAQGRVAAEALVPYPPGIPAVLPGEVIDGDVLRGLRDAVSLGAHLRGATDPTLQHVLVVDDPLAALEASARVGVPGLA
ncbi:MAG: aminotransferase class V-fold PLP-dependent enzyme [Solirubrobacteraceae bacterium]|nr:aminotransferase class V-fold PLP-dependent enzyme [Solirubrobacteraceae bacterium]